MLNDGKNGGNKDDKKIVGNTSLTDKFDTSARPILAVDIEKYRSISLGSTIPN
jgi:hypothetical protein